MELFKIINLQDHINNVGIRFKIQYKNDKEKIKIGEQIDLMTNPKSKEEIDKLIGNSSWTTIRCYVCKESVDKLIGIYSSTFEEFDDNYIHICKKCINKAKKLIDQKKEK